MIFLLHLLALSCRTDNLKTCFMGVRDSHFPTQHTPANLQIFHCWSNSHALVDIDCLISPLGNDSSIYILINLMLASASWALFQSSPMCSSNSCGQVREVRTAVPITLDIFFASMIHHLKVKRGQLCNPALFCCPQLRCL